MLSYICSHDLKFAAVKTEGNGPVRRTSPCSSLRLAQWRKVPLRLSSYLGDGLRDGL
ncbi:mCG122610 [Mus musculus]|nr:mCG122610 [Mus musculus]